jgi:hypothetical protein
MPSEESCQRSIDAIAGGVAMEEVYDLLPG